MTHSFPTRRCSDLPGKDEEVFELVKFRTMLEPDPARGLVSDEQRMTRFGSFLRSTSLDELPTLLNVVKGRAEEHTSELQSLMRISYAVFCLKKKTEQAIQSTQNENYTIQII